MSHLFSANERRTKLAQAQLMLIFTPQLVVSPMKALAKVLQHVDVVQVRPKDLGSDSQNPSSARACFDWAHKVLEAVTPLGASRPLVLVNDRVDVTKALIESGIDGVHLGQDDTPWRVARDLLGPSPLIGLSTHDYDQVRNGSNASVDYLGFGPVFSTKTKGLEGNNNSVSAWVAHRFSPLPLFPIGGITPENSWQLAPVGRAAVASSLLCSEDPELAALEIKAALNARGTEKRQPC